MCLVLKLMGTSNVSTVNSKCNSLLHKYTNQIPRFCGNDELSINTL